MNNKIKELFRRYESGEATDQERELVERWFSKYDEVPVHLDKEENNRVFNDLDNRIDDLLGTKPKKVFRLNRVLKVAAVLALFATAALLTYKNSLTNLFQQKEITYTVLRADKGEKKEIKLSDGTAITLNSGTTIKVPNDFGQVDRQLILTGEAYFVVHRDTSKRFIIQSGKLLTSVLGTTFNIKAYPEEEQQLVTVTSGKVRVEERDQSGKFTMLSDGLVRNQQLVFSENKKDGYQIIKVDADHISSWRNNLLNFNEVSIAEIAVLLERWYNIPVVINNSRPTSRRFTISFDDEPVDNVLRILKELSGITYQIKNNRIEINMDKM